MRKLFIPFSLLLVFLFSSCDFEPDGVFTDDTTEKYELYDYYIDPYGNEGVIAYIYDNKTSGKKYIIAISSDETYLPWGPMGEAIYKNDTITKSGLIAPTFGVVMHQAMKSIGIERFPAQAWCDEKNCGEKLPRAGSWRLPSYQELRLIFGSNGRNISSLNLSLIGMGGKPLNNNNLYWTCVEDFDNYITIDGEKYDYDKENRAIISSPINSTFGYKDRWLKKNKYYVRAIKYVYYKN